MKRRAILWTIAVFIPVTSIAIMPAVAREALEAPTPAAVDAMAPRQVPARTIPVPADVSPELQRAIAVPLGPREQRAGAVPQGIEEWRRAIAAAGEASSRSLAQMRARFPVRVESRILGGVKTYTVAPLQIAPENRRRVLVHLHGGAYVLGGGGAGIGEAVLMAYHGKIRVISIDYRMAPDYPFPAALDDAVAVWKEVIKEHRPGNTGLFGTSAGGALTLATVLKLKELKLPLPGAIAPGTPWADLTGAGDTFFTNQYIDGVIVRGGGFLEACAGLYAASHDLTDPLLSPVYGDFRGFPPSILTTGTRDLLESDTVRVYGKLRRAGVAARLQVFEGLSHAEYVLLFDSPESREAFAEISRFFSAHLGK